MFTIHQTKAGSHARRVGMPQVNLTEEGKKLAHPAPRAPRIFGDSATFADIEPYYDAGIITGLTTNPTLIKNAGATNWAEAKKICSRLLTLMDPYPVSLELTELTQEKMVDQARLMSSWGANVVIKVPVGGYTAIDPSYDPFTGLKVLRALWQMDIKTNATLIFNSTQAFWAANAGATYISPFLGRLADYAYKNDHPERTPGNSLYWIEDHKNAQNIYNTEYVASGGDRKDIGTRLIQEISVIFTNYDIQSEILAASFRNFAQVSECLLAGADILTIPTQVLEQVPFHPLTQTGMKTFVDDSKVFDK